jgi:pre-mRNA-splicing factor 18
LDHFFITPRNTTTLKQTNIYKMDALKALIATKKKQVSETRNQTTNFVKQRDLEILQQEERLNRQKELDDNEKRKATNRQGKSLNLIIRDVEETEGSCIDHTIPSSTSEIITDNDQVVSTSPTTKKDKKRKLDDDVTEDKFSNEGAQHGGRAARHKSDTSDDDDNIETHEHKRKKFSEFKFEPNHDGSLPLTSFSEQAAWPPEKIVLRFFQMLLHAWSWDLEQRTDTEKSSNKGKQNLQALNQCSDHIQPLFRLCKKREVPVDILGQLAAIVLNCEKGDFKTANDHYLQAAIGNAPWPIGLTMVGIHERTGREKISTAKVAHVMNSELQRKYFTSVKRLMGYAQRKRTDVAPSMKVL